MLDTDVEPTLHYLSLCKTFMCFFLTLQGRRPASVTKSQKIKKDENFRCD
jgi:hypothetical protein